MPEDEVVRQPELYFCMVRAIGTNLDAVENILTRKLLKANFVPKKIKLSQAISKELLVQEVATPSENEYQRYDGLMTAGDLLRSCSGRPEAAAILAMEEISRSRAGLRKAIEERNFRGAAFILSSLMHPAEVRALRDVYGPRVFVISAYSHTESRQDRLRDGLTPAAVDMNREVDDLVEELMARDRGRGYPPEAFVSRLLDSSEHRTLSIQKTFDLADFFVDADSRQRRIDQDVTRFLSLILSSQRDAPTKAEMGMAHAYSSRLRSSSLSRQVGAALCDYRGKVLAEGTNEVPKAGGGQYWVDDDQPPHRDVELGYDTSDRARREMFEDLVKRMLQDPSWLAAAVEARIQADATEQEAPAKGEGIDVTDIMTRALMSADIGVAVDAALSTATIRNAQLFDVIEYGRPVHAEMAAICDAASRGVSIQQSTLYCTTFPCHVCASLIVAAGVKRVVYIEPYPKSRVPAMYPDSIALAHQEKRLSGRVIFEPFMGVSPPRHADLFSWTPKKIDDVETRVDRVLTGDLVPWSLESGYVRHTLRVGRGDLADDQQRAVEHHETLLIDEFRRQVSQVQDDYVARIRQIMGTEPS